ncbi:hypothetical protein AB0H49_13700 [Nocardia sp. NPDC050713]|uniref:hypothetical protein n=1 Tax=Nocardia sp. NPDC050713 TaxID=3154511 RepID=UPI0033C62FEA
MSQHYRLRTAIVALAGAASLTFGSAALQAPEATAVPGGPAATQVDHPFDFGGEEQQDDPEKEKKDETAEKAEKNGGGVTTKVIDLLKGNATEAADLLSGILKCTLNVFTDSVKCKM